MWPQCAVLNIKMGTLSCEAMAHSHKYPVDSTLCDRLPAISTYGVNVNIIC